MPGKVETAVKRQAGTLLTPARPFRDEHLSAGQRPVPIIKPAFSACWRGCKAQQRGTRAGLVAGFPETVPCR